MALGDGDTWDESNPVDGTTAIYIDDHMRDLRKGFRSRFALEHECPASQAATAEAGRHKLISMQRQSAAPTAVLSGTQIGVVYVKTVATTGDSLFYLNAATQEVNISNKLYFWYLDGAVEAGTNVSARLQLVSAGKMRSCSVNAKTVPTGAALQFDVLYNGVSLWTATASQPILQIGSTSTSVTSFVTTNVTAGGALTINIDTIGSVIAGGNVTLMIEVG